MNLIESAKTLFAAKKDRAPLAIERAINRAYAYAMSVPDQDQVMKRVGIHRAELRSLLRDPEVAQCVDTRMDSVISTPWRLEPNQDPGNIWLTDQLARHMNDIVIGVYDAILYGYSIMEATWKPGEGADQGRLVIDRIQSKPLEWFSYRRGDGQDGWWCRIPDTGEEFRLDEPRKWFVSVRHATYLNPMGDPLLSRCWFPVWFKTEALKSWNQFLETFGTPIVVGVIPGESRAYDADGNEVDLVEQFVAKMRAAGVKRAFAWKEGSVDTLQNSQPGEFSRLIDSMNAATQKLLLGQTLTSEVGDKGSYAAAKVHDSVRTDKRNSDIRLMTQTVQSIINALANMNGLAAPRFIMADDTGIEMARAQRDALLVEKGVLKLTQDYLLDRYDYREGDFDIPQTAETPPATPAKSEQKSALSFAASPEFTPKQNAIEKGIAATLDSLSAPISGDAIKAAILAAESPEDLEQRLAILLRDSDSTTFNRVFSHALFAADIIGYAHA